MNRLSILLKEFNWQWLLIRAGIVVCLATTLFVWGCSHGKQVCADQRVDEAVAALEKAREFTPTITKQEKDTAEQTARVTKKKEKYDEQVDQNDRPVSCDLTDNELRTFQALVEG